VGPMDKPEAFEDLEAWQMAGKLTNQVHAHCSREPLSKDSGLSGHLRRASLSVMNNIAEGWKSFHQAEKKQFYNFARRSCGEVRSMTYVLGDNATISKHDADSLREQAIHTGKLDSGLIRSVGS